MGHVSDERRLHVGYLRDHSHDYRDRRFSSMPIMNSLTILSTISIIISNMRSNSLVHWAGEAGLPRFGHCSECISEAVEM